MLTTSAESLTNSRPNRVEQRDHDIELLKSIRHKVLGLRVMADQYSRDLSLSFAEPLGRIDAALKALLLERELDS